MDAVEPYSADDLVWVDGDQVRIGDINDPFVRAGFGVGHFPGHGREVVPVPGRTFPYTPDTCLTDLYSGQGEWLPDGTRLFCRGCGLDGT